MADQATTESEILFYAVILCASLSILGSIWIFFIHRQIGKEVFLSEFVFHQAIAAFVYSIAIFIILHSKEGVLGYVADFTKNATRNSSVIWATNMAMFIYTKTVFNSRKIEENFNNLVLGSYGISYGLALLTSIHSLIVGIKDHGGNVTTIYTNFADYVGNYILVYIGIGILVYCYTKTHLFLSREVGISHPKLWLYPSIFCAIWLSAAIVNFNASFITFNFFIELIHLVTSRSVGILNAVFYGPHLLTTYEQKKMLEAIRTSSTIQENSERKESMSDKTMLEEVLRC